MKKKNIKDRLSENSNGFSPPTLDQILQQLNKIKGRNFVNNIDENNISTKSLNTELLSSKNINSSTMITPNDLLGGINKMKKKKEKETSNAIITPNDLVESINKMKKKKDCVSNEKNNDSQNYKQINKNKIKIK